MHDDSRATAAGSARRGVAARPRRRVVGSAGWALVAGLGCSDAARPLPEAPPSRADASTGTCRPEPSPHELSFGVLAPSREVTRAIEIAGASGCALVSATVTSSAFRVGAVQPTEDGFRVELIYAPPDPGPHMARLEVRFEGGAAAEVRLSGEAPTSSAPLLVVPNSLDFGRIGPNCTSRGRTVTLYNTGDAPLEVEAVRLVLGGPAFALVQLPGPLPEAPARLSPGTSTSFDVGFRADAIAEYAGRVEISARFEGEEAFATAVRLAGEGVLGDRQVDEFMQPIPPKVDVLFVIDDTASMVDEQATLARNLQAFAQYMQARWVDYQLGVITTDGRGELRVGPGGARFVTSETLPSPEAAFSAVGAVGTSGPEPSHALESAVRALSEPNLSGVNQGFVRDGAVLSVVFVSDGPDASPRDVEAHLRDLWAIKGPRNTNLFSASAITAPPNPGTCEGPGGRAETAGRLVQVAEGTGGVSQSICTADWSRALEDYSSAGLLFRGRLSLTNQPVVDSLEVEIDGEPFPAEAPNGGSRWRYDFGFNSLEFYPAHTPPPGARIRVSYFAECL